MCSQKAEKSIERIESIILFLRERRIIIDADLARLYGVATKVLNQAVNRNRERFPPDFVFQLTRGEKDEVVTRCDHLRKLKFSHVLPYAFTEYGAVMAANVLNSADAVRTSVSIVRAFVSMRAFLAAGADIGLKLAEIERRVDEHDETFHGVIAALRALATTEPRPVRRIGFQRKGDPE